MYVCGIKATHDASVAVIEDDSLLFSVELEKLHNRERHTHLDRMSLVESILGDFGLSTDDIDIFVIDGWFEGEGTDPASIPLAGAGDAAELRVSSYLGAGNDLLRGEVYDGLFIGGRNRRYYSYPHLASHVIGTWCASPFGRAGLACNVLVWDGGTVPRLFAVEPARARVVYLGALHSLIGNVYSVFAQFYRPFRRPLAEIKDDFSVPGKLMAYVALGRPDPTIIAEIANVFEQFERGWQDAAQPSLESTIAFSCAVHERLRRWQVDDVDVLASFQDFTQQLLLTRLAICLAAGRRDHFTRRLCFTGGSALNIKWNSAIRRAGLVDEFWVPPFPNDSGSALGAACCYLFDKVRPASIDWNVYSGPHLLPSQPPPDWKREHCPIPRLAEFLASTGEPVVFLTGRAELGPRALGHRSILASPISNATKDFLNAAKQRESYRPVAPVCLEADATRLFAPGTPDPYMLFEHHIRNGDAGRLRAVAHVDGTARLQTVSPVEEPQLAMLLGEFGRRSGVPVLCNTSANHKGRGFFPGVIDAVQWGRVPRIWSEGVLYSEPEKTSTAT